ncbi:MAG: undecaprenyl/decaprenyl-phosphate alpha-N-acetylglucosaminyl 1-phosphate transferase [Planctomycetaceae bacterium]|nr:undecaprenyl/decaprenyl-phosphate alpha-N-acetylglucosaminyl 1-phosphate transferase [Planctomycetaceae bacterium]MBV8384395.1 undecaprenyl/decaprenyl-phosphate alpha-N-acetylglucosaminyl 1-phosphate transferase [Planctomycetaceae bacterium]MBV8677965.1 undecaprenyl/decaprenyl-phosphate alpha-N-acetylglucosaminyl 1-phosphate transferase [Planctomycetaceae bacterium]
MLGPSLLVAPLAAFLIGLCAIRAVRRIALAVGFVDSPDRRRKLHEAPIPLGGGVAVWLATWSGWGISLLGCSSGTGEAAGAGWFHAALAIASTMILALGVTDDRYGLRGRQKLAGQVIAALILVGLGPRIDALSCFGAEVELGIFDYPITTLWILLVINAFNLMDGMDGFCGSLGLVASLAIAFLAYGSGRVEDALVGLALAGALAAFLRENLPPARIYLGDAGSMTLGMMVSALSVRACSDGPNTAVSLPPLVALLTLPLLDVATALCRRWLTGRSLYNPDHGHIHHRLRNRLGGAVAALGAAIGLAILGAVGATLAREYGMGDHMAGLAVVISVGLLVFTNTFGRSELRLLSFRLQTAVALFLTWGAARRGAVRQECHLHGIRDWAGVWDALIREVEALGVWRVELAIDMPAAGETYHGLWSLPAASEDEPNWSVVHTLSVGGVPAGILRIAGNVEACRSRYLDRVGELVQVLEGRLEMDVPPPLPFAAPSPGRCDVASDAAPRCQTI